MNWSSRWSPLWVLIFILLKCGISGAMLALEHSVSPRLIVAASHTALSGNLSVLILELPTFEKSVTSVSTTTEDADIIMEEDEDDEIGGQSRNEVFGVPLVLRVLRLDGFSSELVGEVPVENVAASGGNVSLVIPCGFFSRGGTYSLQVQQKSSASQDKFIDVTDLHELQMKTSLDVRWPTPSLSLEPQHLKTYPGQPVLATLEYAGISCTPSAGVPVTTYSLQLIYCGASVLSCDPRNKTHVQALYTEEVKGFPLQRVVTLRCEFFGLAGHYALRLKPTDANPSAPTTSAYIKVEWSDQFVFNVHARSVKPCVGSTGGISVLFEYPSCRLQGDRVRVYGRLRADVASLAPPSSLHYVAELKAPPGKHTLTFDCDIFTERFVEYCFVYVSEAINGAMTEVRVDCIPTYPLQDGNAAGWGPWSQWTPCSSSCVGGTRNRHRFCDTPPPKYGAKFCQGKAVETESCGGTGELDLHGIWNPGDWECRHGTGLAAHRPEVTAEVGTKCRCGCVVNLTDEKPRTILAASTQACPGRSFWLIQTAGEYTVRFHLDQARFPCPKQYIKVRDGDSLSAELLADVAFDKSEPPTGTVISSENSLLVEFFSDEMAAEIESCVGGFLAHVITFQNPTADNGTTISTLLLNPKVMAAAGRWALWLTPAHLVAASLLILMFLVSVILALQYALKYRKYQIAEDLDSLTDNSACSGSMQGLARRARALSSATLISEVVSLVRLPRRGSTKHSRLEEAPADIEDGYESTETQAEVEDEQSVDSGTLKQRESDEYGSQKTIVPSVMSTPTRRSSTSSTSAPGQPEVKYARPVKLRTVGPISPVSEETSTSEGSRRYSVTSASTSVNNVRVPHPKSSTLLQAKGFSPASTSSNISTLRCGKESKDRRNRERLLQGPGSEFSLANPDMDLELDYYDYNVVNAGAAPGSYLGMDPAFLVWIPPLDPGDSEILGAIEEDHYYEEIPDRRSELGSRVKLDTEGAALTAAEYMLVKSRGEDRTVGPDGTRRAEDEILPRRLDPGESRLHDEIITEYRARLSEGLLPIHRLLEESRVRVSEESLARQAQEDPGVQIDIIPNRLVEDGDRSESKEKSESKFTPKTTRNRLQEEHERSKTSGVSRNRHRDDNHDRSRTPGGSPLSVTASKSRKHSNSNPNSGKQSDESDCSTRTAANVRSRLENDTDSHLKNSPVLSGTTRISEEMSRSRALEGNEARSKSSKIRKDTKHQESRDLDRDFCERKDDAISSKPKTPNVQRRYKDITELNTICDSQKIVNPVNIPLKEFPRGRLASPAKVHKSKEARKDVIAQKEIQSPDYGVEVDMKEEPKGSFYDLIGEGEDGFKFADEDEEYVDNKVTA
ncbi:uncharacterized protein LOC107267440 isoform X2 [Cephus cinctus]|uniref:Uncharacterized protein LOC107267440 isoform X2 n=1 Tax=Cephus cinctus TaxID=211228 RepID=A0AAJ7FJD9_CEPCN|nr:uncharacterized protein LOC107267440 isoform X2 [Cephus cinctus]